MSWLLSFLQDVFPEHWARARSRLRRHPVLTIAGLVLLAVTLILLFYSDQCRMAGTYLMYVLQSPVPVWFVVIVILPLCLYAFRTHQFLREHRFVDDFRDGLSNWDCEESWKTERDGEGRYFLSVTDSSDGGIAIPCRLWTDYLFEFQTKIVNKMTSWIIRAADMSNLVMFQCFPRAAFPHYRIADAWYLGKEIVFPRNLPLNKWFSVKIIVKDQHVIVTVILDDKAEEVEIFNADIMLRGTLLTPLRAGKKTEQSIPIHHNFSHGSVGFRAYGKDCAHFRDVRVTRL